MQKLFPMLWSACMAATAIPAWADSTAGGRRADPQDATASVPQAVYRSPFESYRAFGEEKLKPWKEVNDTVGSIGGWRAYAKEAQAPGPIGNFVSPETSEPAAADSLAPAQNRSGDSKTK